MGSSDEGSLPRFPLPLQGSSSSIGTPYEDVIGGRQGSRPQEHGTHIHSNIYQQQSNNSIVSSIQTKLSNIKQQLQTNDILPNNHSKTIATFLSGTIAFYTTSFTSQYIQYKLLKLSTGTRPAIIPISVGMATIAIGSYMGHLAGIGTTAAWSTIQDSWNRHRNINGIIQQFPEIGSKAMQSIDEMTRPMKVFANDLSRSERRERKEAWMHAARM